jgi:D-arabinose 1-dehydrogenase-like Zn-dependent alcohol dehydrogenase
MQTTRRHLLTSFAAAGIAGAIDAQSVSPNDRIHIALIGAGGQGNYDTRNALSLGTAELVAAADVYDGRLKRVREVAGDHIFTTRDYREVLARKDVDAIILATPDHWHATIAIDAMNAGKDVYCEKPMVQQLSEGKAVIEAQNRRSAFCRWAASASAPWFTPRPKNCWRPAPSAS